MFYEAERKNLLKQNIMSKVETSFTKIRHL